MSITLPDTTVRMRTAMGRRLSRMRPNVLASEISMLTGAPDRNAYPTRGTYLAALSAWENGRQESEHCTITAHPVGEDTVVVVCMGSLALEVYQGPCAVDRPGEWMDRFACDYGCLTDHVWYR